MAWPPSLLIINWKKCIPKSTFIVHWQELVAKKLLCWRPELWISFKAVIDKFLTVTWSARWKRRDKICKDDLEHCSLGFQVKKRWLGGEHLYHCATKWPNVWLWSIFFWLYTFRAHPVNCTTKGITTGQGSTILSMFRCSKISQFTMITFVQKNISALISRCTIRFWCRYANPSNICREYLFTNFFLPESTFFWNQIRNSTSLHIFHKQWYWVVVTKHAIVSYNILVLYLFQIFHFCKQWLYLFFYIFMLNARVYVFCWHHITSVLIFTKIYGSKTPLSNFFTPY